MCNLQDVDLPPYGVYVPQSLKESLRILERHNLHSLIVAVGHAAFTDLGFVLRASEVICVEVQVKESAL